MAPTAAVARPRPRDKSVCAGASERDRCVVCCRESVAVKRIGSVSLVRPTRARVRERGTVKTTEHAGVSVRQAARRIHRTVKQKLLPSGESAQHTAPSVGTAAAIRIVITVIVTTMSMSVKPPRRCVLDISYLSGARTNSGRRCRIPRNGSATFPFPELRLVPIVASC